MATLYWIGTAPVVAQISTVQITGHDVATTYTITIGKDAVSVPGTGPDVDSTAAALQAALDASTLPYFAAITWTVSTDTITGTADTEGVPFTATSSVNGGAGTIGSVTTTTAAAGPSIWTTPENWSTGSIPVSTDDVILRDSSVNIAYGLDNNAVLLDSLTVDKTYTGKIGLDRTVFHTSADAATTNSASIEPGDTYLKIGAEFVNIGQNFGSGAPNGSQRIKIDNSDAAATTTTIFETASSSSETGLPSVRLLFSGGGTHTMFVRDAESGVGVAVDEPTETTTISAISVSATGGNTSVQVGAGTSITTFSQTGGSNVIEAAGTITTVNADDGSLLIEGGDYTITNLNGRGATITDNHTKISGAAVTTATITDGTYDLSESSETRTITTLNPDGGRITYDSSIVTVTTLNNPASGVKTMSIS